jgi:hypothetical protein
VPRQSTADAGGWLLWVVPTWIPATEDQMGCAQLPCAYSNIWNTSIPAPPHSILVTSFYSSIYLTMIQN